jgi:tripartite-type tricarboxylate transporter receptor subunit TctC
VPHLATLKTYVVATPQRIDTAKDVPTSAEGGLAAFQAVGWNALFGPKGTPKEIVDRLNVAARAALADPVTRKRLLDLGCIIGEGDALSPEALGAHVRAEIDKWVPVIKAAGVTAN